MRFSVRRIVTGSEDRRIENDILALDRQPYLTWVDPGLAARTTDPALLPYRPQIRRRIVIACHTLMTGGAEKMAVTAAQLLSSRHDVFLWSVAPGEYTINGSIPVACGSDSDFVRFCAENRIDVAIFNNCAALATNDTLRASGIRTILLLHGLTHSVLQPMRATASPARRADAVWAFPRVCGGLRRFGFTQPMYRLDCPVNLTAIPFVKRAWRPPYNIAYIGRIAAEKNLPALMQVWQAVRNRMGDSVHFHVVGGPDGTCPDSDATQRAQAILDGLRATPAARFLESVGAITYHGMVDNVATLLPKFHALTLTSDFEGQPLAIVEAMASGALCAFRDIGEVGELMRGCGILITPASRSMDGTEINAMANALCDLLQDPAQCASRSIAGRERIKARHGDPAWSANFDRMLEDLLAMPTRATVTVANPTRTLSDARTAKERVMALGKLESEFPYLRYGCDAERARVIDPRTLSSAVSRRLKILLYGEFFNVGGAESLLVCLAEFLSQNHDVTVALTCQTIPPDDDPSRKYRVVIGNPKDWAVAEQWDAILHNNAAGWIETRGVAEDRIHIISPYGLVNWNALRLFTDDDKRKPVIWAYPNVAAVLLRMGFVNRAYNLRGGVDLTRWAAKPKKPGRILRVGYVGRISGEKGIPNYCRLMSILKERIPVEGVIVGGADPDSKLGPDIAAFFARSTAEMMAHPNVKAALDSGAVTCVGFQADPLPWYQGLDFLAITSTLEGESVASIEAMATGCVVASRDIGEMGRLAGDGHGVLSASVTRYMDEAEIQDMADKIVALWQNPKAYTKASESSRGYAHKYHGIERMADDFLAIVNAESQPARETLAKPRVTLLVDVPGWSLDRLARRLLPHLTSVDASVHYLYPSLAAAKAKQPPSLADVPDADLTYCLSWYLVHVLRTLGGIRPGRKYLAHVCEDYLWEAQPELFKAVDATVSGFTTFSLPFVLAHPDSVFLPVPINPEYPDRPRPMRNRKPGTLRVGMVANGLAHDSDDDFKGARLCRSVADTLPGVTLEVVGTDRMIPADEMPAWYDSLDVFCCLSKTEAFSTAAAEALALGVPVVATPVSPMVPFVGEAGYTRVSRDSGALRGVLESIRDSGGEWRSDACKYSRSVARLWSAEIVAATIASQIDKALGVEA